MGLRGWSDHEASWSINMSAAREEERVWGEPRREIASIHNIGRPMLLVFLVRVGSR